VLLLNPYHVLKKLRPKIEKFLWNSFLARAVEIGATDMDEPKLDLVADPVPLAEKQATASRPTKTHGRK